MWFARIAHWPDICLYIITDVVCQGCPWPSHVAIWTIIDINLKQPPAPTIEFNTQQDQKQVHKINSICLHWSVGIAELPSCWRGNFKLLRSYTLLRHCTGSSEIATCRLWHLIKKCVRTHGSWTCFNPQIHCGWSAENMSINPLRY